MNKTILIILTAFLLCSLLPGCVQPDIPDSRPSDAVCDHYDMDLDDLCDACGQHLPQQTSPTQPQTQPDYGTPVLRLCATYSLGAYSSGTTTMELFDGYVATAVSIVDTSAAGQGTQRISETGSWHYDADSDQYSVTFGEFHYILEKNADGLFFTQYSFTMKGQTGGHQNISVVPVETN